MAHSLIKVFVHLVWITKERRRLLIPEVGNHVKDHISEYAQNNSIDITTLAIQPEHVHLLASLSRSQRIEDVAKLLKGESSHWINHGSLLRHKFSWQRGYWAGSVCYQHVDRVKSYIANQQEHHRQKSFREEFMALLREEGYSEAEIQILLNDGSR
ncbi:MAG: IS200/IS605 family transposase [Bacteroidota bacterium]